MLVPKGDSLKTSEVRKSRFISIAQPVESAEEARTAVNLIRKEYPDASHVVHAFQCGSGADIFGFSDDREPPGTAGRPVYEVLKGSGITNLIILIVRYFGGTKLGTGGLVKAYTHAAKIVLEGIPVEEQISRTGFDVDVPYEIYDQALKILRNFSADITDQVFDTQIHISGQLPSSEKDLADQAIRDISVGQVCLRFICE